MILGRQSIRHITLPAPARDADRAVLKAALLFEQNREKQSVLKSRFGPVEGIGVIKMKSAFVTIVLLGLGYLLFWPVPIRPAAWDAPSNAGYVGQFAPNDELAGLKRIALNGRTGPEDATFGPDGLLYIVTHEGIIMRYDPATGVVADFAETGGRPLGIGFGPDGTLYVADAYRGLLGVSVDGDVSLLADKTENNTPIHYANNLDIATDGTVYFTDASTRFGARQNGGTLAASMLDLMEHGPNGRVLKFDPATGKTTVVLDGMSFANGVALTASGTHLLVVETGTYSIRKIALQGDVALEAIVENLPGFPDNITRQADGTFWVGVVSPRSGVVDYLSDKPFLRKVVQRLPASIRPAAQRYGFVLHIDETGAVLDTLQDPSGAYALTTGLIEAANGDRYVTSLTEPSLGLLEN